MTVNISDGNVLCGYEAARALDEYIRRLEDREISGLTGKQTATLLKTAKLLRIAVTQSSNT